MSNILNDLGVDKEDVSWFHLSICRGLDTNLFYDKYESDVPTAKSVDDMCFACPVSKFCYNNGVENKEQGVWGGVYLYNGEIDKTKNLHKTKEFWNSIKRKNEIELK